MVSTTEKVEFHLKMRISRQMRMLFENVNFPDKIEFNLLKMYKFKVGKIVKVEKEL